MTTEILWTASILSWCILVWTIANLGGSLSDVIRVLKGLCSLVGAVSISCAIAFMMYCAWSDGYDTVGADGLWKSHVHSYEDFSFILFQENGNLMIGW